MLKPITTMAQEHKSRSKAYSSTRSAFDELPIEEKAFFLLESTAKAVIDGVQEAVQTFSGMCDQTFDEAFTAAHTASDDSASKTSSKKSKAATSKAAKSTGKVKTKSAGKSTAKSTKGSSTASSKKPKSNPNPDTRS